jgi:hypothetical protein
LDWSGAELTHTDLAAENTAMMVTSSSWSFEEVKSRREAWFETTWAEASSTADRLATFHCRRDIAHDAWAPMMQRPQSCTKSITQVELSLRGAEMRYWTRETAILKKLTSPDCAVQLSRVADRDLRQ